MLAVLVVLNLLCGLRSVLAYPTAKRTDQITIDAVTPWENACKAAGGADQCNSIAVTASGTLLAAGLRCDQQNSADSMMDLSKKLNSSTMSNLAQIFIQEPRNSPNGQFVVYCDTAPRNPELLGLFQCQFQGDDSQQFADNNHPVNLGDPGTIPFGLSTPLNPPGSCPANPSGPIPNGQQLGSITTIPRAAGSSVAQSTVTISAASDSSSTATISSLSSSSTTSAILQSGLIAQALNARFATFTASTPCNTSDPTEATACVDFSLAQCVAGQFIVQQCPTSLVCAAVPEGNAPGAVVTCISPVDALARIAATGVAGGLTG